LAIRTAVTLEEARVFLSDYLDPAPLAIAGIARGTVNSSYEVTLPGGRVFVRLYEEQDLAGARAEAARLSLLASRGVRTPAPLARRGRTGNEGFIGQLGGKPAAVFPWCDGDMRCLASVTQQDGLRVGEALARLHLAGADCPRSPGRFEPADLRLRLARVAAASDPALAAEAAPLEAKLATWVERRDARLPRGLVHGDLFRDNVLWLEDGTISALLDFESASDGALAYDLMTTILAWSYRDTLDLGVARSIAEGYERVRPLAAAERRGLLAEAAIVAIRFTTTRLTDDALRAIETGRPRRADKDYRRFLQRLAWLEARGEAGLDEALFA
jgi:homoserine kinase type II